MPHTKGKIQTTAGADLMLFLQPVEGDELIAHFGGENALPDAKRMEACWNALAGVEDPAAFMRDVREMSALNAGDSHSKWIRVRNKVREHLKGGAE